MKLIQQSAEIWQQPAGEIGVYKQIEKAARLCYKSEDKITEDSYKRFMNMLSEKGHNSPLEHGTVYLAFITSNNTPRGTIRYLHNPYSKITFSTWGSTPALYVSTNYRVLLENDWLDDLKYLCEPTEHHEKRISVHITTSRSISHELVRHRVFSFCQESQRYCNYSKGKFDGELTFIIPNWVNTHCFNKEYEEPFYTDQLWYHNMVLSELNYKLLLGHGWKPQEAREVLPNSTKTELIMTGFESQWDEFFKLRCSPAAHPMMQDLANKIKDLVHKEKDK